MIFNGYHFYTDLSERYNEPHRRYHDIQHIENCFGVLARIRALLSKVELTENEEQEIAHMIWFHDVVYNVGPGVQNGDNERASAEAWMASEDSHKLPIWIVRTVRHGILDSAEHHKTLRNLTKSQEIFLDIDLSGLGSDFHTFMESGDDIREEYSWVDDEDFRIGRGKFFKGLLARNFIYYHHVSRGMFEEQARSNINKWIELYG